MFEACRHGRQDLKLDLTEGFIVDLEGELSRRLVDRQEGFTEQRKAIGKDGRVILVQIGLTGWRKMEVLPHEEGELQGRWCRRKRQ